MGRIFKYQRSSHFKILQTQNLIYFVSGKFNFSFPEFGYVALYTLTLVYKSQNASDILY